MQNWCCSMVTFSSAKKAANSKRKYKRIIIRKIMFIVRKFGEEKIDTLQKMLFEYISIKEHEIYSISVIMTENKIPQFGSYGLVSEKSGYDTISFSIKQYKQ